MTINRAAIARQLVPGLDAIFGLSYKDVDAEHKPLFDMGTTERAFEEQVLMSAFGTAPVKNEGSALQYDDASEIYTARYTTETVALGFAITEEAFEDNLYDTVAKLKTKSLARAMGNTKQAKAAAVINNATTNAAPWLGGDGQPLASTTHPTLGAGNLSNLTTADLSEAALEAGIIAVTLFVSDRGILTGTQPRSLHLPAALRFVGHRILYSDLQSGTANNDDNAIKSQSLFPKGMHINHRFTDTDAWTIRTDSPYGLQGFVRIALQTKMEPDFDTGNLRYKARERYVFGFSDWRGVYHGDGSAG